MRQLDLFIVWENAHKCYATSLWDLCLSLSCLFVSRRLHGFSLEGPHSLALTSLHKAPRSLLKLAAPERAGCWRRGGGGDIFLCSVPFNPWGSIQTLRWQSHALGTLSQFLAVPCKNRSSTVWWRSQVLSHGFNSPVIYPNLWFQTSLSLSFLIC